MIMKMEIQRECLLFEQLKNNNLKQTVKLKTA